MDKTAVQAHAPLPKPSETGITDAPKHLPPALDVAPETGKVSPMFRALQMAADLRITVVLFSLAMLLVFWGTLAQVDQGLWTVVRTYFRGAIVFVPLKVLMFNAIEDRTLQIPFPGGWLIGSAMMVNLLAAHAIRFRLAWNRAGILMIHAGLILMMLGEVITGVFAVEGQQMIKEGQTTNRVIEGGRVEFVIIKKLNDNSDEIVSVPQARLEGDPSIDDPNLPFKLYVHKFMGNSKIVQAEKNPGNIATEGIGKGWIAVAVDEVAGVAAEQKFDMPSVYLELLGRDGKVLGTWLFSTHVEAPQWLTYKGERLHLALRHFVTTRDFSFHLTKFEHKVFAGGNTPKDFRSHVRIIESDGSERNVQIYMNAPLYYRGETFYQSSYTSDPITGRADGTILAVVRNPGWLLPYLSCLVVGLGMLWHFGLTLQKFIKRRTTEQLAVGKRLAAANLPQTEKK